MDKFVDFMVVVFVGLLLIIAFLLGVWIVTELLENIFDI